MLFTAIILGGITINYITGDNMFRTILTYFGISVWTYAVHWFMHKYENTILGKIHAIHHMPEYKDYISTEIFEIFVNLTIIGGLLWIPIIMVLENYVGIQLANHYVILAWAIIFTTYHLINYHILSHAVHAQHHTENGVNNYGPEWFDIICNTKAENSEIEDMNSVIANIIVVTALVLSLKDTSYDVVGVFSHLIQ
jgi:sterol desaturase/sphingolipid hydroxylase (fatty acid hydroxylase superfamily)